MGKARHSDYSDDERIRLIRKAFDACDEIYAEDDVRRQFRYETGREWKRKRSVHKKYSDDHEDVG